MELTGEALAALQCDDSFLALGGPGSGKTTLALLKAKAVVPTLKPGQQVLFLSFSRAAVHQVLARGGDLLNAAERKAVIVQTYHAFCLDLIRSHGRLLTGRQPRILYPDRERLNKAGFHGDWNAERERLATHEGIFVFDIFAATATALLRGSLRISDLVSDKYPLIILDEFQDTSDSQWALVQRLAAGSILIFLADPDQRIFDYDAKVDPLRLDKLREELAPTVFDLGEANHRSPNADILGYANAVLRNAKPPATVDVELISFPAYSKGLETHLAVIQMFQSLHKLGIDSPSVAVLGRSNRLVADMSGWLSSDQHKLHGRPLPRVDHEVVWDAELAAAAAQVVGSILEWPQQEQEEAVGRTLDLLADYFQIKGGKTALARSESLRTSADKVHQGQLPRTNAAKHLLTLFQAGIPLVGDPWRDWRTARHTLEYQNDLADVLTNARFTRLFRAGDEIGNRLAEQWTVGGSYGQATGIVRQAIDSIRLMSDQRPSRGCLVMNIHKSKGKEFDGVVLVEGAYSGRFFDQNREEPLFISTRRLLRVGITRARHKVMIVRPADALPLTPGS